jgi:putative endonuclease
MTGLVSYHAGLSAEDAVARAYESSGLSIAHRRWRGQAGEIDLIVHDGDGYVFVEVKKSKTHAAALGRVSHRQAERIMRSAEDFVSQTRAGSLTPMRFDVACVDAMGRVEILENALMAG